MLSDGLVNTIVQQNSNRNHYELSNQVQYRWTQQKETQQKETTQRHPWARHPEQERLRRAEPGAMGGGDQGLHSWCREKAKGAERKVMTASAPALSWFSFSLGSWGDGVG